MDRAGVKLAWDIYLDCIKKGVEPPFDFPEVYKQAEEQDRNQKDRKAAERRVKKSERMGIRITRSDQMTEHKVRAIRMFSRQGMKRMQIAEQLGITFDQVDSVLRGLTWKHVK